ncbi:hypothetical protein N7481_000747 [Penicillium waksmanii]|uniref:uncharacterized protein n=1 Tax=Penicillium waksmanii TaxID=69791 RepID=UPI00254910E0|nr:uncharacterized protein N7481_000747 [Penicillium waksmanii]KAJ6000338.1 hypothetical protein N7481_000747 [Penicillium waksmanii]
MANSLTLFPRLPPEIRILIWEQALAQQWSYTNFHRVKKRIKISGKCHQKQISRVCREARWAMERRATKVEGLGWFDFERHLFFFRDLESSRLLMLSLFVHVELHQIQHVLINPRDASELMHTMDFLSTHFRSIRTIVAVGPWFTPPDRTGPFDPDQDFICTMDNDWSRVISKSPTEINLVPLLDAIQNGREDNKAHLAQYRSALSHDVDRLPDQLPPNLQLLDHCSWRYRTWLDKMHGYCQNSIAPHPPGLFLRTREELRNPFTINSLWAGRVNP